MAMKTWQDLLQRDFKDPGAKYGPRGRGVVAAFDVFAKTDWLSTAGQPLIDESVVRVQSWDGAIAQVSGGHVAQATAKLRPVESQSHARRWWEDAVADAGDYINLFPYIPDSLDEESRELIYTHVYNYNSHLLAEIIGGDDVGLTYFRELLPRFHAGRLPCGWEGSWPAGKLCVF